MLELKTQKCKCWKAGQHCADFQCLGCTNVSSTCSEVKEKTTDGGEEGSHKAEAALRAAPPLPAAAQKTQIKARATTTKPEENLGETMDGEGVAGDLPGYAPTGEDRRINKMYGDWVHSNDKAHLSGRIYNDVIW